MSKLLIRLFQVLCLIQFVGVGQLHAHTISESSPAAHINLSETKHAVPLTDAATLTITWYSTHSQKISRFAAVDIDEEEYEPISSKKNNRKRWLHFYAFLCCYNGQLTPQQQKQPCFL